MTPHEALVKYGHPSQTNKCMTLFEVPKELQVGKIPKRIYCNKDIVEPLKKSFKQLIDTGLVSELETFDGCFNIRQQRGSQVMSMHSWGLAVDFNASANKLGTHGEFSDEFIKCFTDNGFINGRIWKRKDPMHFELK
jgi:hypothetical protein